MEVIEQSYKILTPINRDEILKDLEFAGRISHKSHDKSTKDSAKVFVPSLIKMGHESVIEHHSISVLFIISRFLSHELVRHRIASFTQSSTRYINYTKKGMVFIKPIDMDEYEYSIWYNSAKCSVENYNLLIAHGSKPQKARNVLNDSIATELVVTANLREWRHILKERTSKFADPQMRALMIPLLNEFKSLLPEIFNDIIVEG